jgi:hypothetical protein
MKKYYVELSLIVLSPDEDTAESMGRSVADKLLNDSFSQYVKDAWVNNVWEEENTQG